MAIASSDLFDARLQRVIVIRFDRLASRFGNEFPFHGFWIVEGGREVVVFGHVVGFPRDFFFHLSVFFQDVRVIPGFGEGLALFVRPGRFERRERPAWHVKCGDARALVHTAQAYAHHRSYTCSSGPRAAREREKKKGERKGRGGERHQKRVDAHVHPTTRNIVTQSALRCTGSLVFAFGYRNPSFTHALGRPCSKSRRRRRRRISESARERERERE